MIFNVLVDELVLQEIALGWTIAGRTPAVLSTQFPGRNFIISTNEADLYAGHMQPVESNHTDGKCFHFPPHPVFNSSTTTASTRVVFDGNTSDVPELKQVHIATTGKSDDLLPIANASLES